MNETGTAPLTKPRAYHAVVAVLGAAVDFFYRRVVLEGGTIPAAGPVLLVANHGSWVDALLTGLATPRHVRFMMFAATYNLPWVKPFARVLGIIPISSEQRPRDMLKSLQTATAAIPLNDFIY